MGEMLKQGRENPKTKNGLIVSDSRRPSNEKVPDTLSRWPSSCSHHWCPVCTGVNNSKSLSKHLNQWQITFFTLESSKLCTRAQTIERDSRKTPGIPLESLFWLRRQTGQVVRYYTTCYSTQTTLPEDVAPSPASHTMHGLLHYFGWTFIT